MNCREFQNTIPAFLDNKLTTRQAKQFFEHMDSCAECNEELKIQYLISEGTVRLEEGTSFNLNEELYKKIKDTQEYIKRKRISNMILYCLEALALVAVAFILFLVFWPK
ncbi:MAG: zf-HC2 domain-containing protein [Lachnospiraceae bacterium]|nr:zf-HC2 domain-containing protein [Lachnospiraceae bacterium]